MATQIGSQYRVLLAESDHIKSRNQSAAIGDEIVLTDCGTGDKEIWIARDDYAGYVIEIDGIGYEFCRSI